MPRLKVWRCGGEDILDAPERHVCRTQRAVLWIKGYRESEKQGERRSVSIWLLRHSRCLFYRKEWGLLQVMCRIPARASQSRDVMLREDPFEESLFIRLPAFNSNVRDMVQWDNVFPALAK